MSRINPNLIDVQHAPSGYLGPGDKTFGAEFKAEWLIPRSEWRDRIEARKKAGVSLKRYNLKINNQNPESSCVCNAAETAIRIIRTQQLGVKWSIDLSPMDLYARICSSRHSGSYMMDALNESKENGMLPEDTPKNRKIFRHVFHQNTPWVRKSQLPQGAEITRRHFRPLEWYRLPSDRDAFGSAVLNDWPIVYGRDRHSICAVELDWEEDLKKFLVEYAQSYGTETGDRGYQYDSERNWETDGAWCLRASTVPDDPAKPAGADGLIQE